MDVLVISPVLIRLHNISKPHSSALMIQCFSCKTDWKRNVYLTVVHSRIKGQPGESLPHGVEQSPIVFQPQQLVRCSHIMCDGFLPIKEEGVRSPDVTGQEIIQGKHLHWALKAKSFIFPALTEEHVNSVFLQRK